MTEAVIISRDAGLRQRIQGDRIAWIEDRDELDPTLAHGVGLALIDVGFGSDSGRDIADIVRNCRERGGARVVIAFMSEFGGEAAIKAHLAGADRVIGVAQIEDELAGFLPD